MANNCWVMADRQWLCRRHCDSQRQAGWARTHDIGPLSRAIQPVCIVVSFLLKPCLPCQLTYLLALHVRLWY